MRALAVQRLRDAPPTDVRVSQPLTFPVAYVLTSRCRFTHGLPPCGACHHEVMSPEALLDRISVDPAVCGGRPCIAGHRIWVSLVLGLLAGGMSVQDVVAEYPGIDELDVRACIAYGARLAGSDFVDVA